MKTALHLAFAFLMLSVVTTAVKDEAPAPPPPPEEDALQNICCSQCVKFAPPSTCVFVYHCNINC